MKPRFKTRLRAATALVAVAGALVAAGAAGSAKPAERPATWAQKIEVPGIQNCYQVTTNLYRGAQPTAKGMMQLKAMGIRTIINLRADRSDEKKLEGTALKGERLRMEAWHSDEEDVVRFLKIVSDTNNLPAFVHCQRGADRTGLMCAMYRVAICGWTNADALREMREGGFGYSPLWRNIVTFIEKADVEELKRKAGLESR
jgi:protein tyrosine/serine phosphatase